MRIRISFHARDHFKVRATACSSAPSSLPRSIRSSTSCEFRWCQSLSDASRTSASVVTKVIAMCRKSLLTVCAAGIEPSARRPIPQRTPAKQYHRAHHATRRDHIAPTTRLTSVAPNARAPTPSTIAAGTRNVSFHVPNPSGMGTPMCATAPLAKSTKSTTKSEKRIGSLLRGLLRAADEVSLVAWLIMSSFFNTHHREELQAQVADLGQNPMHSGLVLDWAGDQGLAVRQGRQRQPLKPATPMAVQQTSDTNLVIVSSGYRHRCNVPAIKWIVSVEKE